MIRILCLVFPLLLFIACSSNLQRSGYDRKSGGYSNQKQIEKQERKTEKKVKKVQKKASKESGRFEAASKPWLGTPYLYGGRTKKGVDCSGFVMQIYKEETGISLPHSAGKMYKMGRKISEGDLEEGDLVFFGSVFDIDHVGIYLTGDRFVHASSSKGVMISPMDDVYWSSRYQGAKRIYE